MPPIKYDAYATRAYAFGIYCIYPITRTENAVVCGGILIVMKLAWRTRTREPGLKQQRLIGLPKKSVILTLSARLKRIAEFGLGSVITVKKRFGISTLMTLPTVIESGRFGRMSLSKEKLSIKHLISFFISIFRKKEIVMIFAEKEKKR